MKPIFVMHLHEDNAIYGAERNTLSLFRYLPRESLRIFLACLCAGERRREFFSAAEALFGIEVLAVPMKKKYDISFIGKIKQQLKRNNIQVLHTHGYKADIAGFLATRFSHVRLVSTLHGWVGIDNKLRLNNFIARRALQSFDRVITVSRVLENQAARYVKKEKITYVRNAVDTGYLDSVSALDLNAAFGIDKGNAVIVYVGRLSKEKGADYLLKAASLLKDEKAVFVFVGDGPMKDELEKKVLEYGLCGRVVFTGYRQDALSILKAASLFVLPSLTEGISRSCMEAMGMGVLSLATNVGGMPELIEDGTNGFLVEPGQPEALAKKIDSILQERQRYEALGLEAVRTIKEKFSMQRAADEYEGLYSALTN